jgi:hypothetical protein
LKHPGPTRMLWMSAAGVTAAIMNPPIACASARGQMLGWRAWISAAARCQEEVRNPAGGELVAPMVYWMLTLLPRRNGGFQLGRCESGEVAPVLDSGQLVN